MWKWPACRRHSSYRHGHCQAPIAFLLHALGAGNPISMKRGIDAIRGQKRRMRSAFSQAALIEYQDIVRRLGGGKTSGPKRPRRFPNSTFRSRRPTSLSRT